MGGWGRLPSPRSDLLLLLFLPFEELYERMTLIALLPTLCSLPSPLLQSSL